MQLFFVSIEIPPLTHAKERHSPHSKHSLQVLYFHCHATVHFVHFLFVCSSVVDKMCTNSSYFTVKLAIAFAFIILSVDCIQNITDCVYYPSKIGSIPRNNTLKFICSDENAFDSTVSTLFKPFTCREQFLCGDKCNNHSPKFLVDAISFENCALARLPSDLLGIFNHTKSLNGINLGLSELDPVDFENATRLERLLLSHNQIRVVPSFQFQNLVHLIEIDLSFNQIERIEELAFVDEFPNLRVLNVSHNQLNDTEFVGEMLNLTHLDLSSNKINILPAHIFQELRNLQYLDMSGNPIEHIGSDTFSMSTKLQHLNLSNTLLSIIQPYTFIQLQNLRILDVSHCRLKRLERNVLSPVLKLELLSIAHNQLTELSGFTTENIHNTIIHGIDSNQFNCTYLHQFLLSFVWKQFGSNYVWFNCNQPAKKQKVESEINGKTQSSGLENAIANRKQNDDAAAGDDDADDDLLSLKKYLFVLVSVMIIGFVTIALVFVALVLRVGVCNHHHRQPPHPQLYYANNYFARPPKFIGDNHIYDIIDDDNKWI